MTDFDLEQLGDVWRQQPDPKEIEALKRTAATVRRQARLGQFMDTGLALILSAIVLVLALSNPKLESLLAGGAAILFMLGSSIRQRQLRAWELRSLTGSAEEMLDQSITRTRITLKRARIGLVLAAPGFLIGLLFAAAIDSGQGSSYLQRLAAQPRLAWVVSASFVIIITFGIVRVLHQIRDARRELERLAVLREAYRREKEAESGEATSLP